MERVRLLDVIVHRVSGNCMDGGEKIYRISRLRICRPYVIIERDNYEQGYSWLLGGSTK